LIFLGRTISESQELESQEKDVQPLEYLLLSLESYNKYLRRLLKLRINEIIFSKITLLYFDDKAEIKAIAASFKTEAEAGVLSPVKYLSDQIKAKKLCLPINEIFLVPGEEPVQQIIKEWIAVSAAVIPLFITLVKGFL